MDLITELGRGSQEAERERKIKRERGRQVEREGEICALPSKDLLLVQE